MSSNWEIRKLELTDFSKGFESRLDDDHIVAVIADPTSNTIVATGTVFVERKFLRGKGFGKRIVESLVEEALGRVDVVGTDKGEQVEEAMGRVDADEVWVSGWRARWWWWSGCWEGEGGDGLVGEEEEDDGDGGGVVVEDEEDDGEGGEDCVCVFFKGNKLS